MRANFLILITLFAFLGTYSIGFLPASTVSATREIFCVTGICFPSSGYDSRNILPLINFSKWPRESDLILASQMDEQGNQTFKLTGSTGNASAGFLSPDLTYSGQPVTIQFKNISIVSNQPEKESSQVSLSFNLATPMNDSYSVRFVAGPLFVRGWNNSTYFEGAKPYNCVMLDPENLGGKASLLDTLRSIEMVVEEKSLATLEFSLLDHPLDNCYEIGYNSKL